MTDPIRDEVVKVLAEALVLEINPACRWDAGSILDASPTLARRLSLGTAWDLAAESLEVMANEWRDQAVDIEAATHTASGKPLPLIRRTIAAEVLRSCADEVDEALAALAAKLGSGL